MKKLLVATLIIAAMASSAPLVQFVRAQAVDLGVENVGLLPSNPFYFLKEWGRGVRKFFTANTIRKAQLELSVVNEKAAELEKLVSIAPDNKTGLLNAFLNYQTAVINLNDRLSSFTETTSNVEVSKLVDDILGRVLLHQKIFDRLASQFAQDHSILAPINESYRQVVVLLSTIISNVEEAADFRIRLGELSRAGSGALRQIPALKIADRLTLTVQGGKLTGPDQDQMNALKGELLNEIDGHLQALRLADPDAISEAISTLPGNEFMLLGLVDELREVTNDSEIHNSLNFARQSFLDQLTSKNALDEVVFSYLFDRAKSLLIEDQNLPGGGTRAIKESLSRVTFNLNQAKVFSQEDNFEGAVSQASTAYATAREVWYGLKPALMANKEVVDSLKSYYDSLMTLVKAEGFPGEDNPKIFELLGKTEKQLLGISKLIEGDARPELIADATRNVRVLLAMTDELIYSALNPAPMKLRVLPKVSPNNEIPESATIVISSSGFAPSLIKVKIGTKITWFNKDLQPHWPVSDIAGFDAKNGLSQGETFSFVFEKVGTWKYHDQLYPTLIGLIEVVDK